MKRLSVRLSIVGVLITAGVLGALQLQRASSGEGQAAAEENVPQTAAVVDGDALQPPTSPPAVPQPILEPETLSPVLDPAGGHIAPVQNIAAAPPAGYGQGELLPPPTTPQGYGQPEGYGQPQGYGQSQGYGQPQGAGPPPADVQPPQVSLDPQPQLVLPPGGAIVAMDGSQDPAAAAPLPNALREAGDLPDADLPPAAHLPPDLDLPPDPNLSAPAAPDYVGDPGLSPPPTSLTPAPEDPPAGLAPQGLPTEPPPIGPLAGGGGAAAGPYTSPRGMPATGSSFGPPPVGVPAETAPPTGAPGALAGGSAEPSSGSLPPLDAPPAGYPPGPPMGELPPNPALGAAPTGSDPTPAPLPEHYASNSSPRGPENPDAYADPSRLLPPGVLASGAAAAGATAAGAGRGGPLSYNEPLAGRDSSAATAIQSGPALPIAADAIAGTPGDRQLEGRQTPAVAIEKRAPREIRVGQPATFELLVRNVGEVPAQDVMVMDRVPEGTQFLDATPAPQQLDDGSLIWQFGAIDPGQQKTVSMRLLPQQEGEIGSVARVVFQSQASVRTNCTRPQLQIKQSAPEKVLIGDEVQLTINVSNPGTGAAENVILEADIPAGLAHRKGNQIDCRIGTLQPGESRTVSLMLAASQAGRATSTLRARAEGDLEQEDAIQIEVVAPQLKLALSGPAKRYLRREATFEMQVANPGTAVARDLELVVHLPPEMEFVAASQQGQYQTQNHAIYWRLAELPAGKNGAVQFKTLPVAAGEQELRAEGRGQLNIAGSAKHPLNVESLNELVFTLSDTHDPIEIGSETTYEIRVTNNGSREDQNVQVVAALPPGMRPVKGDGPTRHTIQEQTIAFAALPRLAPNGQAIYRILAAGTQEGDQRIRVQILSKESPTPVTKEEITRVYADR